MKNALLFLALVLAAPLAHAGSLASGNVANCGVTTTWTEGAGIDSSAFRVYGCGACITNTHATESISVYTASEAGAKGGIVKSLPGTGTADCSLSSTCGTVCVPGGKYVLDCAGSACTADVAGQ